MAQITTSRGFSFRRLLVFLRALVLVLSSCFALAPAPRSEARAASITTAPNLSAEVAGHPFVLDQSGHLVVTSGKGKSHTVELAPGSVPSYLAFGLHHGATIPASVPTVDAGSGGKLHFTPLVQTRLDQDLTRVGEAAVASGKHTYLVQPLPVIFGASPGASASRGTNHAWRAGLSTLHKDLASTSGSGTSAGTSTAASNTPNVPTTVQAQTIIPSSILDPNAHSKLLKDMEHLLTIRSGRFANWDQQTFNALKSDLSLGSPKNVASNVSATATARPVYEAQVIAGFGGSATSPQAVPAPEPGTLAIFGLGAIALVYRSRRGH